MSGTSASRSHLLVEIGTEELPPKSLCRLGEAFFEGVLAGLDKAQLSPDREHARWFATPRRLAVFVPQLERVQPDRDEHRLGPAVAAAFEDDGAPRPAAIGFARSCGVEVADLSREQTDKGERLAFQRVVRGAAAKSLVLDIVRQALRDLPVPRPMRWGDLEEAFVRPVHWVLLTLDDAVVEGSLYGCATGSTSRGHRFHHPQDVEIPQAHEYEQRLTGAHVLADPARRRAAIREAAGREAAELGGTLVAPKSLVEEVANLVEWPVPVVGHFDAAFLEVPQEALISSMETHQRFFAVTDDEGALMPHFIGFANVDSVEPAVVKRGYERVIRPRLADARFFWDQDRKAPLAERKAVLAAMVYQKDLGSLWDRCQRVGALAAALAEHLDEDVNEARQAADLAKCDLAAEMVDEFPELQGVMGRYYALEEGLPETVAWAIEEHYLPRFAGDALPERALSRVLGIADRLDTLCGIFAVGMKPSGNKDPYALRRAALGLVRLLVEDGPDLDLREWIEVALAAIDSSVSGAAGQADAVLDFVMERMRAYYADHGVGVDVFEAVWALRPTRLRDFHARVRACQQFRVLEPASALAAANKRIGNILRKAAEDGAMPAEAVDPDLLQDDAERELLKALKSAAADAEPLVQGRDYRGALERLAALRPAVDAFFDQVMVMADSEALRANRLAILSEVKRMFDAVADISMLVIDS